MKVEIKISTDISETHAVIHASKLTPELIKLVELLEGVDVQPFLLTASKDDKSFIIEADQIEIFRVEGGTVKAYNNKAQCFAIGKTLGEIHERYVSSFIRISKFAIVNISYIDYISPSFNGTMHIVMKNGLNDYISRRYLSDFKKQLGL